MFRRLVFCALLILCLLPETARSVPAPAERKILHIRIPESVDLSRLIVLRGGRQLTPMSIKAGQYNYAIDLQYTTNLKLLFFYPGFKVVTAEFRTKEVSSAESYIPQFEPLPMVPLRLRFSYSDGRPIAQSRASLRVRLFWPEPPRLQRSFNEGCIQAFPALTFPHPLEIPIGTTDSNGEVEVEVHSLADDPHFSKRGSAVFVPYLRGFPHDDNAWDLTPSKIEAKTSYPDTVDIQMIYRARVYGVVGKQFLERNGVQSPMGISTTKSGERHRILLLAKAERSETGSSVDAEGAFSMDMKPGTYDLSVQVLDADKGSTEKLILIEKGVVLKEGEDHPIRLQ